MKFDSQSNDWTGAFTDLHKARAAFVKLKTDATGADGADSLLDGHISSIDKALEAVESKVMKAIGERPTFDQAKVELGLADDFHTQEFPDRVISRAVDALDKRVVAEAKVLHKSDPAMALRYTQEMNRRLGRIHEVASQQLRGEESVTAVRGALALGKTDRAHVAAVAHGLGADTKTAAKVARGVEEAASRLGGKFGKLRHAAGSVKDAVKKIDDLSGRASKLITTADDAILNLARSTKSGFSFGGDSSTRECQRVINKLSDYADFAHDTDRGQGLYQVFGEEHHKLIDAVRNIDFNRPLTDADRKVLRTFATELKEREVTLAGDTKKQFEAMKTGIRHIKEISDAAIPGEVVDFKKL
ncbi:MAG: hypothetical protein ACOYJ2_01970, partial [Rickettsiales bacterium]